MALGAPNPQTSQLAAVEQSLRSDPQLQQLVQQATQMGPGKLSWPDLIKLKEQINGRLQQLGTPMPQNFGVTRDGTVEEASGFPWLQAVLTLGGVAAGGLLSGAFTGANAAGSAAGAAGAGAGTTGSTVPVIGTLPTGAASGAMGAGSAGGFFSGMGGAKDILTGLGDLGQVAGRSAEAAGKGRFNEAEINQGQDRNKINLYEAELQNAVNTPRQLAQNAARGDLLKNVQPVSFSNLPGYVRMPQMSGGLTPAALGPDARTAGAALTRESLLNLLNNKFNLPQAPTLTPPPEPSGFDDANKWLGTIGGYAGALGGFFK